MFCPLLEKDVLKRGGERQVEESMELCIVVVCVSILSARARIKVTQEVSLGGVTRVFRVHVAEYRTGIASLQSLPDDFERFVCILV